MNTTEFIQQRTRLWESGRGSIDYGIDITLSELTVSDPRRLEQRFKLPVRDLEEVAKRHPRMPIERAISQYLQETTSRTTKMEAMWKNKQLAADLSDKRTSFCGIGTRKAKMRLNKLAKAGVPMAKILRLALEIQDVNIVAKGSPYFYKQKIYRKKEAMLCELADICQEEGVVYGVQKTNNHMTSYVLYFDLPGAGQISFHTNAISKKWPVYQGEWDGLQNSTLGKLEKAIKELLEANPLPPASVKCTPREK